MTSIVYPPKTQKTAARFMVMLNLLRENAGKEYTAGQIAIFLKVERQKAYVMLDLMVSEGFISYRKELKHKYYFALPTTEAPQPPRKPKNKPPKNLLENADLGDPLDHPILGEARRKAYAEALKKQCNPARALIAALNQYPDY